MAQRDIRLILSDIDGTILPYGNACVSDRMRAAFHAALDAGIHIGPASGRGFSHIPASFDGDAACSATCLATNGMQVFLDGELIQQIYLPREPIAHIAELLEDVPHAGLVAFEDGIPLLVTGDREDLRQSFPIYARECVDVDELPHHDIEKANVFVAGDREATQRVLDYLRPQVTGVGLNLPMVGFLNITPVGWSKASGIDVLCEALGIGLDQVVVFGDGGNDVEMLAHVPHSAAVAEAVPEAKAAAAHVIGSCAHDAVANVIFAIVNGTWPQETVS